MAMTSTARVGHAVGRSVQTFIPIMPPGLSHNDLEAYIYKSKDGGKSTARIRKGNQLKHAEWELFPYLESAAPSAPLEGPISETVKLCYAIGDTAHEEGEPYLDTPDYDNVVKVLHDLCEAIGYYANDKQIWKGNIFQVWAKQPGIFLRFSEAGGSHD